MNQELELEPSSQGHEITRCAPGGPRPLRRRGESCSRPGSDASVELSRVTMKKKIRSAWTGTDDCLRQLRVHVRVDERKWGVGGGVGGWVVSIRRESTKGSFTAQRALASRIQCRTTAGMCILWSTCRWSRRHARQS